MGAEARGFSGISGGAGTSDIDPEELAKEAYERSE